MKTVPMNVAIAKDGERIAYNVYGSGEVTLIFIHGWSCDSRYWLRQIKPFSDKYQVITLDVVGQGHSSATRKDFTIEAFAEDVKTIIEQENISKAILIGHSLGGGIVAQSAKLIQDKVIAIVGVDTLHNVGEELTQASLDATVARLEADFVAAMQGAVAAMFIEGVDQEIIDWAKEDMSSTQKEVSINTYRNFKQRFVSGENCTVFNDVNVPVVTLNGPLLPTNVEANTANIKDYKHFFIDDVGHFPMIEKPEAFNAVLWDVLAYLRTKTG